MQIARLAAEHDLSELSLRAVHDALRAGPPVVPVAPNENRIIRIRQGGDDAPVDPASPRVVSNLLELDAIWQKHKVAPTAVYEALRDAVMPAARPREIFLYAPPLDLNALRNPRSGGRLLAAWAVRAGKTDALNQAIGTRQGEMAQLPASVLKTQLALAAADPSLAIAALGAIAARMKNDTSRTTSELAVHAALPALEGSDSKVAKAALDVLDSCAKGLDSTGQSEPVASLLLLLARRQFSTGDESGGRKRLETYLEATEKNTVRYAGDYSLYVRKQNLERVAGEYAQAGLWADALLTLGRFLVAPVYSGGDPPVDGTLARVLRQLEKNPAAERYQTLRAWTLPEKDRQSVRMLMSALELETTPSVFLRSTPGSGLDVKRKAARPRRQNHSDHQHRPRADRSGPRLRQAR